MDERPPSLWVGMWKRFLIGGVLIVLLSGGATATVALNTASGLAHEIFPAVNQIKLREASSRRNTAAAHRPS